MGGHATHSKQTPIQLRYIWTVFLKGQNEGINFKKLDKNGQIKA
jgi:hypothetical protein